MRKIYSLLFIGLLFLTALRAEDVTYSDGWGSPGITIQSQSGQTVELNFSIQEFGIQTKRINGEDMVELTLPDVFLPNDEGAPNLPGMGRYIAIPQGATATVNMVEFRTELFENIMVAPAPRIPWDTENGPLEYSRNQEIYNTNAFYPEQPVSISDPTGVRGIDAAILGITPFQYNPVTKELLVYRDIKIEISFEGGNGHFGEDRLRSRWWDPILRDAFINQESIPHIDYSKSFQGTKDVGCEYLIISPNSPGFLSWADSIKQFRTEQGIQTDVITIGEIGTNSAITIENFVNDAYNTWDIPPAAVLILGDYGTNPDNGIMSPIWNNYCVSDNIYADVNNNDMPDIIFARIAAQNATHLETMISKFLNYERTPPTSEGFYNHPITALGWQTERWFQICSETVGGFLKNELNKEPVRVNEVYGGNPDVDPWSTATNTNTVLNVFGPNGLNYIPSSPSELGDWAGGNADDINEAINNGSFMLQHRDHGFEQGWGEPDYGSSDIPGLTNTDLTFVFSINCLTGKYNLSGECFTEVFHRYKYNGQNSGALGLIAASEVSYSFVNDVYVWGLYDNLWPDFFPQYGTQVDHRGILPAFGNAAGKYFLKQSSWPYNTGNKEVTYNLFHHHGDAFLSVFSEVPQNLTVLHNEHLLAGNETFTVLADEGAFIALTVNGEIIGTGDSDGSPSEIVIPAQTAGNEVLVTVTKQNYYRHQSTVEVVDSNIPYVVNKSFELDDAAGNGNGLMDYGETISLDVDMENIGMLQAGDVMVSLSSDNEFIDIQTGAVSFGNIPAGSSTFIEDAFIFDVSGQIGDLENVIFTLEATDGSDTWESQIVIQSHAPVLELVSFSIEDPAGNNNGRIDPGETAEITVTMINNGSADAYNIAGDLNCIEPDISVNTTAQSYGDLTGGESAESTFTVEAGFSVPEGTQAEFELMLTADGGVNTTVDFMTVIGKFTALVLDLDPMHYSGPEIQATFDDMEIYAEYTTTFPEDLGLYKNVFVSLGLHFTNYELTEEEGQLLKEYLLDGGNLYMEGRVTWADDPQTPVHSMFNIDVVNYTMFLIQEVNGTTGSFASNLSFGYDGNNPVNDYSIEPVAPAFGLFTTQDIEHGAMVAFNEGTYRTIGSTIEFGKLVDGESPSTKAELMQLFLDWFEGTLTGVDENNAVQNNTGLTACSPNPFTDATVLEVNLHESVFISLKVYNLQGQAIKTLFEGEMQKGTNQIPWDGANLQGEPCDAGIYIVKLVNGTQTISTKLIKQ
ncbi:MAG: T9SS type A sorting domain-containing protein [Bacteroidetes bacterium]|nr:T9SS type A sorting domain-containing protein [Bacteroidota bacterium]